MEILYRDLLNTIQAEKQRLEKEKKKVLKEKENETERYKELTQMFYDGKIDELDDVISMIVMKYNYGETDYWSKRNKGE